MKKLIFIIVFVLSFRFVYTQDFTIKPELKRDKENYIINFSVDKYVDVTISIEDEQGSIERHLASGMLGANAPEPFQKNELKQTVVWDGKDDQGQYLGAGNYKIRVSLGLKPEFEKNSFWSPYKSLSETNMPLFAQHKEGMLVYEGHVLDQIKLFDHKGNYVKTVYPFSNSVINEISSIPRHVDDKGVFTLKQGHHQTTHLTSGKNSGFVKSGVDVNNNWDAGVSGKAVDSLVMGEDVLYVASYKVNMLPMKSDSKNFNMQGPESNLVGFSNGKEWLDGQQNIKVPPTSMVYIKETNSLIATGYVWSEDFGSGGFNLNASHVVCQISLNDQMSKPKILIGNEKKFGKGDNEFTMPTSIDIDSKGNFYVSDYGNNRIQVFSKEFKLIKTLECNLPAKVMVHKVTNEIFVCSWPIRSSLAFIPEKIFTPYLVSLGTLENPESKFKLDLKFSGHGIATDINRLVGNYEKNFGFQMNIALDSYADLPTFWVQLVKGDSILVLELNNNKLNIIKNFKSEASKVLSDLRPPTLSYQKLRVQPKSGKLYIFNGSADEGKAFSLVNILDPEANTSEKIVLPMDVEDMAFDLEGNAYLRTKRNITRFDSKSWREMPFDYGEEAFNLSFSSSRNSGPGSKQLASVASSLHLSLFRSGHQGGMNVNVNGDLVVSFRVAGEKNLKKRLADGGVRDERMDPYNYTVYPGRAVTGLVQIFDKFGKIQFEDAVPGIGMTHGIGIDKDRNVYADLVATKYDKGKAPVNESTDTLAKLIPGKTKIIADSDSKTMVPIPVSNAEKPNREPDAYSNYRLPIWIENSAWTYGGTGYNGRNRNAPAFGCNCWSSRFDLDYFARSFAPIVDHNQVAVLDKNGNVITIIGAEGTVEDDGKIITSNASGVYLAYAPYIAVHTDKRLFISDTGNSRIVTVRLKYHKSESINLRDITEK